MTQTTEFMRPRGVEPQENKYQLHWKKGEIDTVCAYCDTNRQLTNILTAGEKPVSHGICKGHFHDEMMQLLEMKSAK